MWHLALLAHTHLQALRLEVVKLPNCKRAITLGDALALHRSQENLPQNSISV